jgi:hypothetical protein
MLMHWIISRRLKVYIPAVADEAMEQNKGPNPKKARPYPRRETMKIMLRAAIAALSIASIGSAYADGGQGPVANSYFTELPGVIAQAPVQNAPSIATARNGQAIGTYVTNSNHGTWLFAPNQNQGNGS